MWFTDFNGSPSSGVHSIGRELTHIPFAGDTDTHCVGQLHNDATDLFGGSWESAWIDIGGEG